VKRIGLTQINRPERGFATTIEANPELDLRNAARSKISNVSSMFPLFPPLLVLLLLPPFMGVQELLLPLFPPVLSVGVASTGVVASVVIIVGILLPVSRYETTLVVKDRILGKIGSDTKDGIESVSLNSGLNGGSGGSGSYSIGASVASGSVSLTSVHELVTHGPGYNVDVLSRAVGIGFYEKSKTGSAPLEIYAEML
jgi:hypothetical protein